MDYIDPKYLVDEMYSVITEEDCATLSKYICDKNNISFEDVCFMYENGIYISDETIMEGARELFGEIFYNTIILNYIRMN